MLPIYLLVATLFTALGCAKPDVSSESGFGSVSLSVTAEDVERVTVAVSGPDFDEMAPFELERDGDQWIGVFGGIPIGVDRTFHGVGYDAGGAPVYEGRAEHVAITANETIAVVLVLQQIDTPDSFHNTPPRIESLVASSNRVAPEQTVALQVTATDADDDPLTTTWSADGGSFEPESGSVTTWRAPAEPGQRLITVTVTDERGGRRSLDLSIDVQDSHAKGGATLEVGLNTWPEIGFITAEPSRVEPGQSVMLSAEVSDSDGDALLYAWSQEGDDCTGTFDDDTLPSPVWTASATTPSDHECTLELTVQDGRGGSNVGTIRVFVGAPEDVNLSPAILRTFQSRLHVAPEGSVRFELDASDPEGSELSFGWQASEGEFTTQDNDGSRARATWVAPRTCAPVIVTATVTDTAGVSTQHTFDVSIDMPTDEGDNEGEFCRAGVPSVRQRLGAEGGVINAFDGAISLEIPPGAIPAFDEDGDGVEDTIPITITPDAFVIDGDFIPSFALEPHGMMFEKPVLITLDYDRFVEPDADPELVTLTKFSEDGEGLILPTIADPTTNTLSAELEEFSNLAIAAFCNHLAPKAVSVSPSRPILIEGNSDLLTASIVGVPLAPPVWRTNRSDIVNVTSGTTTITANALQPGVAKVTAHVASCVSFRVFVPHAALIPQDVQIAGSLLAWSVGGTLATVNTLLSAVNYLDAALALALPTFKTIVLPLEVVGTSFVSVEDATCANASCEDDNNVCTANCSDGECSYLPTNEGGPCPNEGGLLGGCTRDVCRSGTCAHEVDPACLAILCFLAGICHL